jgi:transcriptional regulator with XRE-family HTH domain
VQLCCSASSFTIAAPKSAFTQIELADRAGMTQPQLSRLESGGATPTVPLLVRLAAALDADLDIAFRPHTRAAA